MRRSNDCLCQGRWRCNSRCLSVCLIASKTKQIKKLGRDGNEICKNCDNGPRNRFWVILLWLSWLLPHEPTWPGSESAPTWPLSRRQEPFKGRFLTKCRRWTIGFCLGPAWTGWYSGLFRVRPCSRGLLRASGLLVFACAILVSSLFRFFHQLECFEFFVFLPNKRVLFY